MRDVGRDDGAHGATIDGDAQDDESSRSILLPERLERGHLGRAGSAPRCPEIQHDELAREILERRVTIAREGPELEGRSTLTFLQLGDTRFLEGVESRAVLGGLRLRAALR